jgi:hypothetical protein
LARVGGWQVGGIGWHSDVTKLETRKDKEPYRKEP